MCTSILMNKKKTIAAFNLDLLDMQHRVRTDASGVFIEINDVKEGWMPLFGANDRGDFVGMPTCWPHDMRSNPTGNEENVIMLDIDFLMKKKTLEEIRNIVENKKVTSVPGLTFMSQLSDKYGNVLQIIPGQGYNYFEKPHYKVLTNFSPFKGDSEKHPWMGYDRYQKACKMLEDANDDFDVKDCFNVLKEVAQTVCPTVVSMVYDVTNKKVYWCENRKFDLIDEYKFYL